MPGDLNPQAEPPFKCVRNSQYFLIVCVLVSFCGVLCAGTDNRRFTVLGKPCVDFFTTRLDPDPTQTNLALGWVLGPDLGTKMDFGLYWKAENCIHVAPSQPQGPCGAGPAKPSGSQRRDRLLSQCPKQFRTTLGHAHVLSWPIFCMGFATAGNNAGLSSLHKNSCLAYRASHSYARCKGSGRCPYPDTDGSCGI
jgi:hypothetical protein